MYSLLFQAERLVSAHGGDSIRQADTFSDLLFKKFPHRFQMLPGKILPFSRQLFQNAPDHVALQKRRFAAHRITQHNRIFLCGCIPLHQLIRLLLQIFLFKKFLFKPIKEIIAKRQAEVDGVYDEAEKAREDAANAKTSYEQHLLTAKEEADAITTRAMKNAREQSEALISDAKEEAAAIREKAEKDIAQEKKQAANEMKSEISVLAVDLASKVVRKEIDAADHEQLIEQFIEELGDAS